MSHAEHTIMDPDEISEFLDSNSTGVLSMSTDQSPYSIPVSYGFDTNEVRFYFRLVSSDDSEKDRHLSETTEVTVVVCEESDRAETIRYRSVIARGPLRRIEREEMTVEHIKQYGLARRPLFDLWEPPSQELTVRLYVLDPTAMSGRSVTISPDQDGSPDS